MFVRAVYTERTDMEKARTDVLYYALKEKGYPDDFCREIAYKQMNPDIPQQGCWDICTGYRTHARKM